MKNRHNTFELCDRANKILREAGFERVAVSSKSEAVYWKLPGRHGNLRVSAHRNKHTQIGVGDTVSKLTFHGTGNHMPHVLTCHPAKIETMIQLAVGRYFLESAKPREPKYKGSKSANPPGK